VTVSQTSVRNQGYGASTPGGTGKPVYHVTNLKDSGAGSLRDALSQGNRMVVFDVAGTINLLSVLPIAGSYITVDGFSAPSPGITIRQAGLQISYSSQHDIVIRGVRIRNPGVYSSEGDGITMKNNVYNILVDHVSVDGATDGNIDITRGAHDVTVQWSVLSHSGKNMLINYQADRVSLHHNLWVDAPWRNPNIQYTDGSTSVDANTTADFRNNLVWGWGDSGGGTILKCGAKANVINNYYFSGATTLARQKNAIVNDGCYGNASWPIASFYASGNVSGDDVDINVRNVSSPFPAAAVDTQNACTGAASALAGAGVAPRDAIDQQLHGSISLMGCPAP
jgi:pectate lyase